MALTHAVIPAAGLGTRLRPATWAVPKELLPLAGRPVLQHVVEELATVGVTDVVLVSSAAKSMLAEHLAAVADAIGVRVDVVLQPHPYGLGDAVRCAEGRCGDGPFVVALGDALVGAAVTRRLVQLVDDRGLDGAIALERIPPERSDRYGIAAVGADGLITDLVEKPAPADAPSDLAVAARYVLPPTVFTALAALAADGVSRPPGAELQLTDAIAAVVRAGARIAAVPLPDGTRRFDIGSHAGYVAAATAFALAEPELAAAVRAEVAIDEAERLGHRDG
jgi:UTP--glucose-1-phosphate uridylyltransferase